jgi:5'-3' exonuclease
MRVHLVDGTFELYRAHFAPRPGKAVLRGGQQTDVKATVGFMGSMCALLSEKAEAVTHIAVAFDNPITSFRNGLFDGYKTDEGVPPELRAQFDLVEEAARALGIVVWSMKEFEADDALATAALRFAGDVEQVRILSPDKDLGACARGDHVVLVDRIRRRVINEAAVRERHGVGPEQIADLLALTGDAADGVPGVPGFGAKRAAALLARWGSVEQIPDDAAAWDVRIPGAPRLAATLASMREEVALYKRLTTLATDVPLTESLADLAWRGADREHVTRLCDELDAGAVLARVPRFVTA